MRWPYRKVKSLTRLIHEVKHVTSRGASAEAQASLATWAEQLQDVEVRARVALLMP